MTNTELTDDYRVPSLNPGDRLRFIYPNYGSKFPEYAAHSGQLCTIVRSLNHPDEYENMGDPAYVVRFDDGWMCELAWESELHGLDYPWPNKHDKNGNEVHLAV